MIEIRSPEMPPLPTTHTRKTRLLKIPTLVNPIHRVPTLEMPIAGIPMFKMPSRKAPTTRICILKIRLYTIRLARNPIHRTRIFLVKTPSPGTLWSKTLMIRETLLEIHIPVSFLIRMPITKNRSFGTTWIRTRMIGISNLRRTSPMAETTLKTLCATHLAKTPIPRMRLRVGHTRETRSHETHSPKTCLFNARPFRTPSMTLKISLAIRPNARSTPTEASMRVKTYRETLMMG